MTLVRTRGLTSFALCLLAVLPATPAGAGAEYDAIEGEVIVLDPFEAQGRTDDSPPLKLIGLVGEPSNVPRSLERIGSDKLRDLDVRRIEDLAPFVAGATNATIYGIAGVPFIRGDLGDVAQNGQRRAFNRNAFPVSFNSVESVDVVAGAAPVVLGYATGTGGMANFVTKSPISGVTRTTVTVSAGSWDDYRAQIDTMAPLSETLSWRFSLERAHADGFHRLADSDSWNGHLALAWRPSDRARWDLSFEAYYVNFVENPGTNRPTQALIDRGEYITGSSVQNGGTGSYFGNTFTPTGVATIDGSQVLIAPGDEGLARTQTVQLVGEFATDGDRTITSRTLVENVSGEKYSGYTFYSYFPRSRTFEQRIEIAESRTLGGLAHDLLWGAAIRGEDRVSYVDFFNEAMNPFDLTLDPATYVFPVNQLFGVRPVPGRPGRFAVSGANYGVFPTTSLSQTLHSRLFNAGVFVNDAVALTERLTLNLGARVDAVSVSSEDPLPAAGRDPISDSLVKYLPAGTVGLAWRTSELATVYFTWQRAAAVESSSGTGGFGLTANRLPDELFENASELFEAGLKFASPDRRLAGSVAAYRQQRHRTNPRQGRPDEILVSGVEAVAEWKASDGFSLSGNFTYRDAHYIDGPLPGSIATVPRFDPATPSGTFGAFPAGDYRLPGLSRWQANVFATWTLTQGLTARLWGSMQGDQNLDLFGHVVIPAQRTWNAGFTYTRGGFEARIDVLNFTDEFNWRATSTPFAGADLVTRELPRSWRVTLRQSF
ncbi:MAG TPA: TonB-dependent receptor [Opitutaceae bacterium]|nr:TonB-dependent receptor [Opitutaceae bacterium]